MDEHVIYAVREGVAILAVDNPPVNMLSQAVRRDLLRAIGRAQSDDTVRAVVLCGEGKTFPAGADIREFEQPAAKPHLPDVCNAIEGCSKPVVACLHGSALGGGYELALAAHARLAVAGTNVGFPEISLGVLPGAGGTQRLPRLVGAEQALSMMLSGKPLRLMQGQTQGLVDGLVDGDLISAGVAHALSMADEPTRRLREDRRWFRDGVAYQEAVALAQEKHSEHPVPAAAAIIDCVEAAPLLPFEQGLALERDLFLELRDTPTAKALRYAFIAIRTAAKPPKGLPAAPAVQMIAIVGGGRMGSGIAVSCLDAGLNVTLIERDAALAARAEGAVESIYQRAVSRGSLAAETQAKRLEKLAISDDIASANSADVVIECIADDVEEKEALLKELGAILPEDTIIATNTSYLDVERLGQASGRPDRFLALHFFTPAHVQQLVEIGVTERTSAATEATAYALARQLRKRPVRAGAAPGLIGNRVLTAFRHAADALVLKGASPYAVDAAMRSFGFALGPYQVLDLTGIELSLDFRAAFA
ncbi:MAG: 3-hydroxyacyl-CoA dehydrogenase NAD-binding domain-containing protein, partial [Pseudomonadota bacterium]